MVRPERRAAEALPSRFRRLWLATGISNLGDGVRVASFPLLATEFTRDPRLISGVTVAATVPKALLILPGGVWADRYDRRRMRVGLDVVRAVVMSALTVLIVTDKASIGALFVVAAVLAGAESVVDSSSMAMVPMLVSDHQLEQAGSRLTSTELIAGGLVGPPLGGFLFAVALALPFGLDTASFLLAALVASTISGDFVARASSPPTPSPASQSPASHRAGRSFGRELGAGFSWLWRHELLRNLALVSVALGFGTTMHSAVLVLYARDDLGLGPLGFGLLLAPAAVGGVAGSMLATQLTEISLRIVLPSAVAISAVAVLLVATTTSAVAVAFLGFVEAAAVLVWNVLTVALRQRLIPDDLLGRVSATYRFALFVALPFGALAGGVLADRLSVRSVFLVAGVAQLVVAAVVPFAVRATDARNGAAVRRS